MISLKAFLITMFLFIADWSDIIPKNFVKQAQKVPVRVGRRSYLR